MEDIANRMIIQKFGKVEEQKLGVYSLYMKQHEMSYTFSYGIRNESKDPLVFELDCTESKGMVFSEMGGKVNQYVKPGDFVFLMHVEAAEGQDEFSLGTKVTWTTA